jgi:hypothetical protein
MRRTQRIAKRRRRTKSRQRGGNNLIFNIQYGSQKVKGQELTQGQTKEKPSLQIPIDHYVVMSDPDAVKPDYIHWITTGTKDILPYHGPTPPPGTGVHRYIFYLVKGPPPTPPQSRGGQSTVDFVQNPLATAFFTVSS